MIARFLLLAAAAAALQSCSRTTLRQLGELGQIELPSRLENRRLSENPGFALFPFERVSNSFADMGSSTPIAERLVFAVAMPAFREEARKQVAAAASKWSRAGACELGETVIGVNASSHPAWIVVRDAGLATVGYTVWKSDSSAAQACQLVEQVLNSYRNQTSVDAYLKAAAERPARLRRSRFDKLTAQLAARGVRLAVDAEPVEKDGILYDLFLAPNAGKIFAIMSYLGALPYAPSFRASQSPLDLMWFEGRSGMWNPHGAPDPKILSDRAMRWIERRHRQDANRAHFYAIRVDLLDDLEMPEPDPDSFAKLAAQAAEQFRSGRLIEK